MTAATTRAGTVAASVTGAGLGRRGRSRGAYDGARPRAYDGHQCYDSPEPTPVRGLSRPRA